MTNTEKPITQEYNACLIAKQTTVQRMKTFITKLRTATVHTDLCRPMRNAPHGGCAYFLALTPGKQNYILIKMLNDTSRIT